VSARITVVVPAYNYAHYLPDALDSVLAQTVSDWECVIVDDGSTDDTAAVAAAYVARDSRFRYLLQDNAGPAAARNNALRNSTGRYIQLLDADDRLAPRKLETHGRFLDERPDADLVYSMATFFRTEEPHRVLHSMYGRLSRPLLQKVYGAEEALEKLQEFNITPPVAVLFRRTVIERVGFFNESSRGCEDWDFWLRCAIAGAAIVYLPSDEPAGFIRTHDASISHSSAGMMRALVGAARTFQDMPAAHQWSGPMLPRVYEMAIGIDDVLSGRRAAGVRRIWRASRAARASLTRIRWGVYAATGLVLPRRAFHWFVTRPMPEWGLELVRRLKG
jgi:glycosyltransferase involved in cell wall biosynthesis